MDVTDGEVTDWGELIEDAGGAADELREEGWEVIEVRPGGISPMEAGPLPGIVAVLEEGAFEPIEATLEAGTSFTQAEVYRRTVDGVTYAIALELDDATRTAAAIPLAYDRTEFAAAFEAAEEAGELYVHLRSPEAEDGVVFSHENPALFVDEGPSSN